MRARLKAINVKYLRSFKNVTLLDRVRNSPIQDEHSEWKKIHRQKKHGNKWKIKREADHTKYGVRP